jgi:hypothetical protein
MEKNSPRYARLEGAIAPPKPTPIQKIGIPEYRKQNHSEEAQRKPTLL